SIYYMDTFYGSWTDRYIHGRKVLLLATTMGQIVKMALLILNVKMINWRKYLLLPLIRLDAYFSFIQPYNSDCCKRHYSNINNSIRNTFENDWKVVMSRCSNFYSNWNIV